MQAPTTPVRLCPLCGEPSSYDEITEFYYCGHCDQFVQWLPDSYTLMVTGPPGAGKTPILHHWIDFYLRNNRPVVLLAFDDSPSNLRGPLGGYTQEKLPEYEGKGIATLVDCYSSIAGVPSQEKYALKSRTDLNELSLLITDLFNEKSKLGTPKIIVDSATPLFTYKDPQLVVQFLSSMAVKVKSKGGAFLTSLTSGTISEENVRRLQTLMDFAIELRVIEVEGRQKRQVRIVKARGQRAYEEWIPIYIGTKAVSVDVGDDPAKYERLRKALQSKPP
ncbi:MAG: RAD55 family ATPase [Candidatus Bathyarchaeia archaeon]